MKIVYHDSRLERKLSSSKEVQKAIKNKKLMERTLNLMRQITFYDSLWGVALIPGVRLHPLKGELAGIYSLDVPNKTSGYRICFIPLDGEDIQGEIITTLPPNPKLKSITRIRILNRCNDKEPKEIKTLKQRYMQYRNKN